MKNKGKIANIKDIRFLFQSYHLWILVKLQRSKMDSIVNVILARSIRFHYSYYSQLLGINRLKICIWFWVNISIFLINSRKYKKKMKKEKIKHTETKDLKNDKGRNDKKR